MSPAIDPRLTAAAIANDEAREALDNLDGLLWAELHAPGSLLAGSHEAEMRQALGAPVSERRWSVARALSRRPYSARLIMTSLDRNYPALGKELASQTALAATHLMYQLRTGHRRLGEAIRAVDQVIDEAKSIGLRTPMDGGALRVKVVHLLTDDTEAVQQFLEHAPEAAAAIVKALSETSLCSAVQAPGVSALVTFLTPQMAQTLSPGIDELVEFIDKGKSPTDCAPLVCRLVGQNATDPESVLRRAHAFRYFQLHPVVAWKIGQTLSAEPGLKQKLFSDPTTQSITCLIEAATRSVNAAKSAVRLVAIASEATNAGVHSESELVLLRMHAEGAHNAVLANTPTHKHAGVESDGLQMIFAGDPAGKASYEASLKSIAAAQALVL